VRDGLELLLDGDPAGDLRRPRLQTGAEATAEEREHAAQLAEHAGVQLIEKARKIRGGEAAR